MEVYSSTRTDKFTSNIQYAHKNIKNTKMK